MRRKDLFAGAERVQRLEHQKHSTCFWIRLSWSNSFGLCLPNNDTFGEEKQNGWFFQDRIEILQHGDKKNTGLQFLGASQRVDKCMGHANVKHYNSWLNIKV